MDGENNGKPYEQMDDLEGKPTILGNPQNIPQNTPKWSFLVGKPMVVGYHHLWKHPYQKTC